MNFLIYFIASQFLLCEVPKCGSTNWKRALLTMEGIGAEKNLSTQIRGDEAHGFGVLL